MQETKVIKRILTPKMLILGTVAAILAAYLSLWNVAVWTLFPAREYNWGLTWNGIISGPFIFITFAVLLQFLLPSKYRLTAQQLGLLWVFTAGACIAASFRAPGAYLANLWSWRIAQPQQTTWGPYVPTPGLWSPSANVLQPMYKGGMPVPGEWLLPLAFWMTFALAGIFQSIGLMLLLRRRWIEVEEVTFPYAQMVSDLVQVGEPFTVASTKRMLKGRVKFIFIGLLLGGVLWLPFTLRMLFTWFPSIYGWESWPWVPWHPGALDLNRAVPAINTILPGSWMVSFYPLFWGLAILAPPSVSLSTGVFSVILSGLLPAICYFAGAYPAEITRMADAHTIWYFIGKTEPLKLGPFGVIGSGYAMALVPLFLDWKYYAGVLKSAFGLRKMTEEEGRSEPFHLRWSMLLMLGGFAIQVVMATMAGANILGTIVGWVTIILFCLAISRAAGEVGWFPEVSDYHGALVYNIVYPDVTMNNMTPQYVSTMLFWGGRFGGHVLGMAAYLVQPVASMTSFRIGSLLKIPSRDVVISYSVGALVSVLFGWPFFLWLNYTYGIRNLPGLNTAYNWGFYINTIDPASERAFFTMPVLQWIVAGFVITAFLMVMSRRYFWWPLAPIGLFLATSVTGWAMGAATACLFGYVIKQVVLKVGGAKFYEDSIVPLIGGLVGGLAINAALSYLVVALRTFYPGII